MIDTKNPVIEFNAQDRCDRCGAQALMSAARDGLELLFCKHHAEQYNLALELDDWTLAYDVAGLEKLYEKPTSTVDA